MIFVVLIRKQRLFQIWRLLEEITYTLIRNAFFLALERKFWDFNNNLIKLFFFLDFYLSCIFVSNAQICLNRIFRFEEFQTLLQ